MGMKARVRVAPECDALEQIKAEQLDGPVVLTRAFLIPFSIEDGEKRRQELGAKQLEIQTALGSRDWRDEYGQRLGSREYWRRRKAEEQRLITVIAELRFVKNWLRTHRQQAFEVRPQSLESTRDIITAAAQVLRSIQRDLGPDGFDDHEKDVTSALESWIAKNPVKADGGGAP
jgi:hypothetical protein